MKMFPSCCTVFALMAAWPAAATVVESGHTGVWGHPDRSGEGFTVEILGGDAASVVWFTFDEVGAPRWAYALGQIVQSADGRRIESRMSMKVAAGSSRQATIPPPSSHDASAARR